MWYILDGYNLLFRKITDEVGFAEQRHELIQWLETAAFDQRLEMSVVFDAQYQPELQVRTHKRQLEMIFTDPNKTADDTILEMIDRCKTPKNCTVVTSDKALARQARQLGAKTLAIQEFIKILGKQRRSVAPRSSPSKEKHLSQESPEFERWLTLFEERWKYR